MPTSYATFSMTNMQLVFELPVSCTHFPAWQVSTALAFNDNHIIYNHLDMQ